jgi:hypothetical protein
MSNVVDALVKDILDFLAQNPGASVLVALMILYLIGRHILLPLTLPLINSATGRSDDQVDISRSLTDLATNQQTAIGKTLTSIETLNKELVIQQEKTNTYFDKLVLSSDKQVDSMERWLTAIGEGVKGIMDSHETLALDRFNMMQGLILQIATKQNTLEVDMRTAFNHIGERLYSIQQKLDNNPTEPIPAVVVEDKPNE